MNTKQRLFLKDIKNKKTICALLVLLLSFSAVFLLCENISPILADDVYYMSFTKYGIKNFVDSTTEHYMTHNGRAFVHFVLEIVLLFKQHLYALLIPAFIALGGGALAYIISEKNKFIILVSSALSLFCFFLLSDKNIINAVMWMSGGFNYLFPMPFVVITYAVLLKAKLKSVFSRLGVAVLLFLSGATTELYGAFILALIVLSGIENYVTGRKIRKRYYFAFFISLFGYATVLLSPSTFKRIENEHVFSLGDWVKTFGESSVYLIGGIAIILLLAFIVFLSGFKAYKEGKRATAFVYMSAIAVVLLIIICLAFEYKIIASLLFMLCSLLIGVCFFKKGNAELGKFVIAGYASFFILSFAGGGYDNTVIPCMLSYIYCISYILSEGMLKQKFKVMGVASIFLIVLSVYNFSGIYM